MFFYPKTVETRNSKINGEIKVTKLLGSYRLIVGGCTQSGGLLNNIWKKALKSSKKDLNKKQPKILILGFGAGTAAQIIHNYWPQSTITGIEIDPIIIDLAKKYFKIDNIPQVKIIISDAIKWTLEKEKKQKNFYDLILVDMYIGSRLPSEVKNSHFLKALNSIISPDGSIFFNQLIVKGKKQQIIELKTILDEIFVNVRRIRTPANAVFKAEKNEKN